MLMIPKLFYNSTGPNYAVRDASNAVISAGNQFRSASAAFAAAASLGCWSSDFDVTALSSIDATTTTAAAAGSSVSMTCCPPRNYTRVANYSRQLTAQTAALPSTKYRRRRRKSGGGSGGDDDPWNGDGGGFGGSGGDGSGGDGPEGGGEDEFNKRCWMHDIMLIWAIFCTWSTCSVVYMATREKLSSPMYVPSDFGEASA